MQDVSEITTTPGEIVIRLIIRLDAQAEFVSAPAHVTLQLEHQGAQAVLAEPEPNFLPPPSVQLTDSAHDRVAPANNPPAAAAAPKPRPKPQPRPRPAPAPTEKGMTRPAFLAAATELGFDSKQVMELLGVRSLQEIEDLQDALVTLEAMSELAPPAAAQSAEPKDELDDMVFTTPGEAEPAPAPAPAPSPTPAAEPWEYLKDSRFRAACRDLNYTSNAAVQKLVAGAMKGKPPTREAMREHLALLRKERALEGKRDLSELNTGVPA